MTMIAAAAAVVATVIRFDLILPHFPLLLVSSVIFLNIFESLVYLTFLFDSVNSYVIYFFISLFLY